MGQAPAWLWEQSGRQHPRNPALTPLLVSSQACIPHTIKNPYDVICDCKFCYILWRLYEEKEWVLEHNKHSLNNSSSYY